jgi:hypothetical protein
MIKLPAYGSPADDGRKSETFDYPAQKALDGDQLPAYDTHGPSHSTSIRMAMTPYHD